MLEVDINLDPGVIITIHNNDMLNDLHFCYCNFPIGCTEYQPNIESINSNSGDKSTMFKNRGRYFILFLPKIEEIRHLSKFTNASVIRISEIKLMGLP